jgi:hypothetical protein
VIVERLTMKKYKVDITVNIIFEIEDMEKSEIENIKNILITRAKSWIISRNGLDGIRKEETSLRSTNLGLKYVIINDDTASFFEYDD